MDFRALCAADFAAYHRLMLQVHALHAENRPDCYVDCDPFSEADYCAMLQDERIITLAAAEAGEVIGLAVVRMRVTPPGTPMQPRRVAFIDDVVVDEAHRGRGVGTALLARLRALPEVASADSVELMVWAFNASAMRMYEKAGFTMRSAILEYRK